MPYLYLPFMAEAHGNRTHHRHLSVPVTGFEVQGPHQEPSASKKDDIMT